MENPQLIRVATYMVIIFVGFLVFLPSKVRFLRAQFLTEDVHRGFPLKIEFFQKHWLPFEIFGKLIFASAIIYNEVTMALWRYAREIALRGLVPGSYGWDPSDILK